MPGVLRAAQRGVDGGMQFAGCLRNYLEPVILPVHRTADPKGGRHTGNSLMQDAGVDRELRIRGVGHADR